MQKSKILKSLGIVLFVLLSVSCKAKSSKSESAGRNKSVFIES